MALTHDEFKRRATAARVLRGYTQDALGELFKEDGLGKHDPGRIERGDLAMQRIHMDAFKRHLRMPEEWWEEADIDQVLGVSRPATPEQIAALDRVRRLGEGSPKRKPNPGESPEADSASDGPNQGH